MIKRFIRYYRPHKTIFTLDMLASLLVALISALYPMLTRRALHDLIPSRNYRMIVVFGAALLAL